MKKFSIYIILLLVPFGLVLVALILSAIVLISPFLLLGYIYKLKHERKMNDFENDPPQDNLKKIVSRYGSRRDYGAK